MFDIFIKGLLFVPAYACVVYAVIFITNWKSLQTSQRLFAFALLAMVNSSLQFVCLMTNDVEACKTLVYTSSFASPTLISLLFLFVYSQMQTKGIFQLKLLPVYLLPVIPCAMLVLNRIIYGSGQTDVIAERIITDDDNIQLTWLVELEYFIFKLILFVGDAVIIMYSIYKIRWFESGLEKYMADTDSKIIPLRKQLTMTLLLFVAVSLSLFIKHLVPREYFFICAEIYGVFLMALTVHTCRAVHHGYARMPIEGEDVDRMEAEMDFLVDSFDERTLSLLSASPKENADIAAIPVSQEAQATSEKTDTTDNLPTPDNSLAPDSSLIPDNSLALDNPTSSETSASLLPDSTLDNANPNDDASKRDVIEYVQASAIEQELKRVMIVKKLYLQQNITIKDVANAIGTNHYYLSVYLNRMQHTSFSDYINRLRIEREVLPRMKDNPQISTKELILAGNFTHRTTFYRAFQKVMGVPFQDYKASLKV